MKKPLPKLNPRVPHAVKRTFRRGKAPEERASEAIANVPRITNETVAEHREEVLSSARKYIYPLQHSKHRVVRISVVLFIGVLAIFFLYCGLALYKFQATDGFIYGVTKVIPFPVAKAGPSWISYENYLFELRRNMHYYHTQQRVDFSTRDGKLQLVRLKQQAMDEVIQAAYVKQLAATHHVSVSQQAVNNQVALVRNENRLGSSDRVLRDVLNQFWGWSETDFKRELQQQLLQQQVVSTLDTATHQRAETVLKQLQGGADFATLAGQYSDDLATKGNGGQYPAPITPTDRDIAPQITAALFSLKPGQFSDIVSTGYTLEIVKVIDTSGDSLHGAHIQFTLQGISTYLKPLAAKEPPHKYIRF